MQRKKKLSRNRKERNYSFLLHDTLSNSNNQEFFFDSQTLIFKKFQGTVSNRKDVCEKYLTVLFSLNYPPNSDNMLANIKKMI